MIHALRLAEELAALLDELQTERVPLDALARLVPDHLAEHWQRNRDVLAVIAEAWPRLLAAERALDPAERRHRLLTELAAQWHAAPPERRIVAAGSTGSIPATRALLRVIARLPRGTVVLPGLDQDIDEASWRVLTPAHPQYGLKQLLDALDVERTAIRQWPAPGIVGSDPARAGLLGEAMRPAATSTAWQRLTSPPPAAPRGWRSSGIPTCRRSLGARVAHARGARGPGPHRRAGHPRSAARAPRRRRAAPVGHRGRRPRGHTARSDATRRLPAPHRAPGDRGRDAGCAACRAQAPVRPARPGSGRAARAGARSSWRVCAVPAWPGALAACWSSCVAPMPVRATISEGGRISAV